MKIETITADGHFPATDLQENTKEIRELRRLIENWLMYGLTAVLFFCLIFMWWALPVFIRLVNHLLSSN